MKKIYVITIFYKMFKNDRKCKTHVKTLQDLSLLAKLDAECAQLYCYYRFEIQVI